MSKNLDTIIFDLGGVLIDWNPAYVFRKVFADESEMHFFFREICTPEWNAQQDAGRPLAEATNWLLEQHPEYEAEIRSYYGRWEEMLGGAFDGTVRILEQLHQMGRHRLYALTNWSHETFPVAQKHFSFLQLFEGIVVSGEEKLAKPDPRIYHTLLDRYAVRPQNAAFIDDNEHNIAVAREIGLHAIHFQSPELLEEALLELGVLE